MQLAEQVAETIVTGNYVDKEHTDKIALMCGIYLDLENIQIGDFQNFYQQPEKEGEQNDTDRDR